MGLENVSLSLYASDVIENEKLEITGKIEERTLQSKNGGVYIKYVIPVKKIDGSEWQLWVFKKDVAKIVRTCGRQLKDYLGKHIVVGLEQVVDESGEEVRTKDGKLVQSIYIKSIE